MAISASFTISLSTWSRPPSGVYFSYTLVYGMLLKHFVKQCKILSYKQPSRVYKVDYRKITAEFWKTDKSDKPAEDIGIKK